MSTASTTVITGPSTGSGSISFTGTVTCPAATPTGTVEFDENGTSLGSGANVSISPTSSKATVALSLSVGTHTLTATYSGDSNCTLSISSPFVVIVTTNSLTVKRDLFDGATYQRAIARVHSSASVRNVFVGGSDGSESDLAAAALTAVDAAVHPDNFFLPLTHTRAERVDADIILVKMFYRMRYGTTKPSVSAIQLVSIRPGWDSFPTYYDLSAFTSGLPNGALLLSQSTPKGLTSELQSEPFVYPIDNVSIRTVLTTDPQNAVAALRGKVNSAGVLFGSYTYPANTLLFLSADVTPYDVGSAVVYDVKYRFQSSRIGFFRQTRPSWSGSAWLPASGGATYIQQKESASFGGAFPYHTP